MLHFLRLFLLITVSLLSACHFYRPDLQQGNEIKQTDVNALKIGMSKVEVQQHLGSPILAPRVDENRWDYVYSLDSLKKGKGQRRLSLFFKKGKLARLEGDLVGDRPSIQTKK